MKSAILGALACLGAASAACAGTTLVVPGQYANAEAPSQAVLILHGDTHLQFQYAASSFGNAPLTFEGVQFRYDAIVSNAQQPVYHYDFDSSFKVQIGTAANAMGARSATYANNLGADTLTVLSGAQTIAANVGGPAGQLKQFGFTLNFTAPFLYDPTLGDLVLDLYFPNDNQFGTFDYVRTDPSMGLVYATSNSATGAVVANSGPVTQFLIRTPGGGGGSIGPGGGVAAVPEPTTWAMMILGFGGIGLLQRRRRMRLAPA